MDEAGQKDSSTVQEIPFIFYSVNLGLWVTQHLIMEVKQLLNNFVDGSIEAELYCRFWST